MVMNEQILVLLIHNEPDPARSLKRALELQSVHVIEARSLREARNILKGDSPPHLIFTDPKLSDGIWADVFTLAAKAPLAADVIVVSRVVDTRLYVETLEAGAIDFVTPPFREADLKHVLRCATAHVLARREVQVRREQTPAGMLFPVTSPERRAHRGATRPGGQVLRVKPA
jgi:DNA-binding NtrC family response regulator